MELFKVFDKTTRRHRRQKPQKKHPAGEDGTRIVRVRGKYPNHYTTRPNLDFMWNEMSSQGGRKNLRISMDSGTRIWSVSSLGSLNFRNGLVVEWLRRTIQNRQSCRVCGFHSHRGPISMLWLQVTLSSLTSGVDLRSGPFHP